MKEEMQNFLLTAVKDYENVVAIDRSNALALYNLALLY
jgi:hypothetical protein